MLISKEHDSCFCLLRGIGVDHAVGVLVAISHSIISFIRCNSFPSEDPSGFENSANGVGFLHLVIVQAGTYSLILDEAVNLLLLGSSEKFQISRAQFLKVHF